MKDMSITHDCVTTQSLQLVSLPKFKPITLSDLPKIKSVLQCAPSRSCDYTIGGIYLWIEWFNYEYSIVNNTLFIKGRSENNPNITAFSLPIGEMDIDRAVDLLKHYCSVHNMPLVFSAIPDDCMSMFSKYVDARVEPLSAWSDYVYNASDLATLSGKKFQKKRNHVNRFIADNPNYKFESITADALPELCHFFYDLQSASTDVSPMAQYEATSVLEVLLSGNALGFEGALLRDNDGKIVSFTFGEVVGDTLHVHIEKMNHDVAGAGAAINKLFVEQMLARHQDIKYVNRQDDAGDEGLRRAKLSYNPAYILNKYNVYITNNYE
jgi:hypothetical protein